MIFNKNFDDITFQDVVDLVSEGVAECEVLDYKEEFDKPSSIANLISAMANTYGGYIIFGVSEKKSTNEPDKIVGLELPEKQIEARLVSAQFEHISPPVLSVSSRFLKSKDGLTKVLLVYVPESDLTPHCVENGTIVYIKIKDQKRPLEKKEYERATLGYIEWLKNRRKKYVDLRERILEQMDSHQATLRNKYSREDNDSNSSIRVSTRVYPKYAKETFWELGVFPRYVVNCLSKIRKELDIVHNMRNSAHAEDGIFAYASYDSFEYFLGFTRHGFVNTSNITLVDDKQEMYMDFGRILKFAMIGLTIGLTPLEDVSYRGIVKTEIEISGISGLRVTNIPVSFENIVFPHDLTCQLEDRVSSILEFSPLVDGFSPRSSSLSFYSKLLYSLGFHGDIDRSSELLYKWTCSQLNIDQMKETVYG